MIERYRSKTDSFGLPQENIEVVVGNLLSDPPHPSSLTSEEFRDFDLITVGQALHFFPSAAEAVEQLAGRLKPDGVLFIQDLYAEEGRKADTGGKQRPRGYTKDDIKVLMDSAGLEEFRLEVLPEMEVELPSEVVLRVRYFLARAVRPPS
jgi:SAM-dependent methyltransferase